METAYIVQPFEVHKIKGNEVLKPLTPLQFGNGQDAVRRAERLAEKHIGVVAVAQDYDEETGEFGKTVVLSQFGRVPEELFG